MRLLVVSQYFWPENFRINDLVSEMVRRGHEVTVLTGLPNYPEGSLYADFRADPRRFAELSGARIVRVPILLRRQGALWLMLNYVSFVVSASLLGAWKLRGESFDAIFAYQLSPVTSVLPAVLLRFLKKAPLVMWVLDLWPETLSAVGVIRSKKSIELVGALVSFIYNRCDLILGQSKGFLSNIKLRANSSRRVEYFPSWAEVVYSGDNEDIAPEIFKESGVFNVMFAGNVGEAQDFTSILTAAERLRDRPDIRWIVLGDGRAAPWLAAEIERRQLTGTVIMLGRYPLERMPGFFAHADALLVALKDEPIFSLTIPGKIQSYLATGIPIVGMLNGEGARVISESGGGLVGPAGDADELARNVLRLSDMNLDTRKEIGRRGKAAYMREFDRQALMDQLEHWLVGLRRSA
ncbi:MAG: glycosyltransferase family 4 protein [Allorhizobium sp.]